MNDNAGKEHIAELEKNIEQMQAMIDFQSQMHNKQVDLGVEREKEINRLRRELKEKTNEG